MNFKTCYSLIVIYLLMFIHGVKGKNILFDRYYYYPSNQPVNIIQSSQEYTIGLTAEDFKLYDRNFYYNFLNSYVVEKKMNVNCPLIISFGQGKGIRTCYDDDNKQYLFSNDPGLKWKPHKGQEATSVECEGWKDIIEGDQFVMQCKPTKTTDNDIKEIKSGWIQGSFNITHSYSTDIGNFHDQHFEGFYSGEGIFFYCVSISSNETTTTECYTVIMEVHPKLMVDVKGFYETPQVPEIHNCFKCYAKGALINLKRYIWTFNGDKLNNDKDEICFEKLPAGNYTVECLVTTDVQKSSDEMELTIKTTSEIRPETPDCQQDNQSTENFNQKGKNITIIILAASTSILIIIVFVLLYLLKIERTSKAEKVYFQRNNDLDTLDNMDSNRVHIT